MITGNCDPVADPDPAADPGRKQQTPRLPVIDEQPSDLIALRNKATRFYCRADGYPSPDVSWLKDGVPLKSGKEIKVYDLLGINVEHRPGAGFQ